MLLWLVVVRSRLLDSRAHRTAITIRTVRIICRAPVSCVGCSSSATVTDAIGRTDDRAAGAVQRIEPTLHLTLHHQPHKALMVGQQLHRVVVMRVRNVNAVDRQYAIAHQDLAVLVRHTALGQPRDVDSLGTILERDVALTTGNAKPEPLPDLIPDQRRVQDHLLRDLLSVQQLHIERRCSSTTYAVTVRQPDRVRRQCTTVGRGSARYRWW
uniref:Putative secreted peptide n=1 Tax=Anopheles braziliensis TaxID=58242 RepID=A0A2M3ZXS1_9DIPT